MYKIATQGDDQKMRQCERVGEELSGGNADDDHIIVPPRA